MQAQVLCSSSAAAASSQYDVANCRLSKIFLSKNRLAFEKKRKFGSVCMRNSMKGLPAVRIVFETASEESEKSVAESAGSGMHAKDLEERDESLEQQELLSSTGASAPYPPGTSFRELSFTDHHLLLLGIVPSVMTGALSCVMLAAIPTLLAMKRAAEALVDTAREELPGTMAAVRLSGMEISDLTMELSDLGPSTLHASSSSRSFTYARGCLRPTSFSNPWKTCYRRSSVCIARAEAPDGAGKSEDSVDISVFRFTLGIPGFDDSDLPRVLGILFGGLLIVNHFSSLSSLTAAQLRSEAVGLVLAALSVSLPFIGRQLNGANKIQRTLEPGQKQVFCLADGLTDNQRQDLAWVSYNLLRNTSTTAMLVWHSGQVVSARGFWGALADSGPGIALPLGSLKQKLEGKLEDFSKLKEPLYLSGSADGQGWEIVPSGTASVLVQPFPKDSNVENDGTIQGFLLLISRTPAGYRRKDRQWTASLAKKLSEVLSE